MYLGEALPAFVMNLKWLSLGKRCSRNWFFFFLLSVTYILCKKGPLGQKTHFKGITVKGKHALGQLLFYSLLLDTYVLYILQRFSYKKVRKCNAKNLLKTYCIPEFQEIPEIRKKVNFESSSLFSECNQRYSVFYICETTRSN